MPAMKVKGEVLINRSLLEGLVKVYQYSDYTRLSQRERVALVCESIHKSLLQYEHRLRETFNQAKKEGKSPDEIKIMFANKIKSLNDVDFSYEGKYFEISDLEVVKLSPSEHSALKNFANPSPSSKEGNVLKFPNYQADGPEAST